MNKKLLVISLLLGLTASAQDHFSGMTTSKNAGILKVAINPAELANLNTNFEFQIFSVSANFSNNKVGIKDVNGNTDFNDLIFKGNTPVNARVDAEVYGPGFAMKKGKWGFAFTTKGYAKSNAVDVDPKLGEAITSASVNSIVSGPQTISNNYNQRLNGTSWGEIGLSAARNLFENEKHKFNAGATLKLLFPGAYANFGMDKFQGTITYGVNDIYLNNTQAHLNIAYSGKLANGFASANDYLQNLYGALSGVAADLSVNYRLKDQDENDYKLNVGLSFRNIGGMTFKNSNNVSNNYILNIQPTLANPNGLALSQFQNAKSITDVENILLNSGYVTKTDSNKDFKVKLPTVISAYVDLKVIPKFYVGLYTQQKLGKDNKDNQITTQNTVSLTPRFATKNFEVFSPWSTNEISGVMGGLGFRAGYFYMGTGSGITALISNSKQADIYLGLRFGI